MSCCALAENVFNGIVVHLGTESEAGSSLLLDMTPESAWVDNEDPALEPGFSYVDSETTTRGDLADTADCA